MSRLVTAFLLALLCHAGLGFIPMTLPAPQLPGKRTIRINLASPSADNEQPDLLGTRPDNHTRDTSTDSEDKEQQSNKTPVQKQPEAIQPKETVRIQVHKGKKKIARKTLLPTDNKPVTISSAAQIPKPVSNGNKHKTETAPEPTSRATPKQTENRKPTYPKLARLRGWQGHVVILAQVFADGSTGQVTIDTSSGYPILDKSALQAVQHWIFSPGRTNGRPVTTEVLVPVYFKLD